MAGVVRLRLVVAVLLVVAVVLTALETPAVAAAPELPAAGSRPAGDVSLPVAGRAAPRGRLRGRVLSTTTGKPVPGVVLRFYGSEAHRTVTTDRRGRYTVRIAAGRYTVLLEADGYLLLERVVRVRKGRLRTRVFRIPPIQDVRVSGTVRDASGQGWPLAATVEVTIEVHGDVYAIKRVTSEPATGRWAVTAPAGSAIEVTATAGPRSGYAPAVVDAQVGTRPVDLRTGLVLDPASCGAALGYESRNPSGTGAPCRALSGGLVAGYVTSGLAGVGLFNAQVSAVGDPVQTRTLIRTDGLPAGLYALFSPAGARTFTVRRPLYATATRSVDVPESRVLRLDVPLAAGRVTVTPTVFRGTVSDTPVTGSVTVANTGTAPVQVSMSTIAQYGSTTVPETAWEDLPPLPAPVADNGAALLDGVLYSIGGRNGTGPEPTSAVYAYAGSGWTRVADLPVALSDPTVGGTAHRVVVVQGYDREHRPQAGTWVYDPAVDRWSRGAAIADGKADSAAAVLGDRFVVVAGCGEAGCDEAPDRRLDLYDVAEGIVTGSGGFPRAVAAERPQCAGLEHRVYCTGGMTYDADHPVGATWFYDPAAEAVTPLPEPPVGLVDGAVSATGGRLVVSGGLQDGVRSDRTWAYDPAGRTWEELAPSGQALTGAAGACGHYRVGGTRADGTPVATVQRLVGLPSWCGDMDIPWISVSPNNLTLAPGASQRVRISVDARGLRPNTASGVIEALDDAPGQALSVSVDIRIP